MKVALVLGNKSEMIRERVSEIKDNLSMDCYTTVENFISACIYSGVCYDRVVLVSNLVKGNQELLEDLVTYWRDYSPRTEFVMLSKKGTDEDLASEFTFAFSSPLCTAMLVGNTSIQTVVAASCTDTVELSKRYGVPLDSDVHIDEDVLTIPEPPIPSQVQQSQAEGAPQPQAGVPQTEVSETGADIPLQPEKKKGFFGKVFGGKKRQVQEQTLGEQPTDSTSQPQEEQGYYSQQGEQGYYSQQASQDYPTQQGEQDYYSQQDYPQDGTQGYYPQQDQSYSQDGQVYYSQGGDYPYEQGQYADLEQGRPQDYVGQEYDQSQSSVDYSMQDNGFSSQDPQNFNEFEQVGQEQYSQTEQDFYSQDGYYSDQTQDYYEQQDFQGEEQQGYYSHDSQPQMQDMNSSYEQGGAYEGYEQQMYDDSQSNFENPNNYSEAYEMPQDPYSQPQYDESQGYQNFDNSQYSDYQSPMQAPQPQYEDYQGGYGVNPDFSDINSAGSSLDEPPQFDPSFEYAQPQSEQGYTPEGNFSPSTKVPEQDFDEVDLDFGDISAADLEDQYRQETDKPKVIEKEVVREVIKEVPVGGNVGKSILSSIYAGRTRKIILVTGDRGSGVTSLACDLAFEFAKHIPTLYFDADVETHGLLNYISYFDFRKYSDACRQGVRICRNASAFRNCVIRFDDNLDLLSSDFGVEVDDEQLQLCQSVVAEVSNEYGVVVIDVPMEKLHLFTEILPLATVLVTVEASRRGYMNFVCRVEDSPLNIRFKRMIAGRGLMMVTKASNKTNLQDIRKYVDSILDFEDGVNWLEMDSDFRLTEINDKFLETIVER